MQRNFVKLTVISALSGLVTGCFSDGPSSDDILQAYSESYNEGLKIMRMDGPLMDSVDWRECKELSSEAGWSCSFKATFDNGQSVDQVGTFIKTSSGWKYKPN